MPFEEIFLGLRARLANNRQAIRSVAALSGGNLVSTGIGIVGALLTARFVEPEVAGLFRSFTIPLMYLTVLHAGTFDGLYRQIPFYTGQGKPDKVEAIASSAGAWNLLVSSIASFGFLVCGLYSGWHHDLHGVVGWLSQAFCVWGVLYYGYVGATYRTLNHFVALARIQLWQAIVNFGMVFLLPLLQFYGLCLRAAFSSIIGVWLIHRNRPLKISYRFDFKALAEVVRIGLPFSFWGSLYTSVWAATESALMLSLGGVTALGLFAVAAVLRDGMSILPQAANQVLMPRIVETFARDGNVHNANARSVWITSWLTGMMVLATLILTYLLDIFVPIAVPKYVEGIPLMKICLWFGVIQTASLPLNTLFATGRSWLYGRGVVVGLLVFPLAAYLLAPLLGGVLAVAVGSLFGRSARTIAAYGEIFLLMRREVR